jgi:hypothetical protein
MKGVVDSRKHGALFPTDKTCIDSVGVAGFRGVVNGGMSESSPSQTKPGVQVLE